MLLYKPIIRSIQGHASITFIIPGWRVYHTVWFFILRLPARPFLGLFDKVYLFPIKFTYLLESIYSYRWFFCFARRVVQHLRYLLLLASHPCLIWKHWMLARFLHTLCLVGHQLLSPYPLPPLISSIVLRGCLQRAYLLGEKFGVPIYCPLLCGGS